MKSFLAFFFLCLNLNSIAQNWAPFPLDGTSEWRVYSAVMNSGVSCYSQWDKVYSVGGDTTINANSYQKLNLDYLYYADPWYCVNGGTFSTIAGFIRQEGPEVFFRYPNGNEAILFDWSLEVGDTIPGEIVYSPEFQGSVLRVESIDSVEVGGEWRKRFHSEWNEGWIIEGVGHSGGLIEFFGASLAGNNQLVCYGESDVPLYPQFSSCSFVVNVDEETDEILVISPNPSTGTFRVETPQKSIYRIYSAFGSLVKEGQLDGASEIDLSSEPNGIYLITIESEKGIHSEKLVKQ